MEQHGQKRNAEKVRPKRGKKADEQLGSLKRQESGSDPVLTHGSNPNMTLLHRS
jgi:hypothetical protein